jgi:hypothetical protein
MVFLSGEEIAIQQGKFIILVNYVTSHVTPVELEVQTIFGATTE